METSVNNKCKAFTSLKQSKKLAEILPFESADMCYPLPCEDGDKPLLEQGGFGSTPCWSLAALLGVLPESDGNPLNIERVKAEDGYDGYFYHIEYKDKILIPYSKNPIDACVAMIERLNELNLL